MRYYNAWFESDHLYIQTELCDCSLELQAGQSQPLSEAELLVVMRQVRCLLHVPLFLHTIFMKVRQSGDL